MQFFAMVLLGTLFTGTSVQVQNEPYRMSEAQIYAIQTVLYELNYDVEQNGELDFETMKAIAEFQEGTGHAVTGYLSEEEYDYLISVDTTAVWGAIAISSDGVVHPGWGYASRAELESSTLADCREESSFPEDCIAIINMSVKPEEEAWIAVVQCEQNSSVDYAYITVHSGASKPDAVDAAYSSVTSIGYRKNVCTVRTVIEARGRHQE